MIEHAMKQKLLCDADAIIRAAVRDVLPDAAVKRALERRVFTRPVTLFAVGKAAWRMARAALDALGRENVKQGVVVTKYGHAEGALAPLKVFEAGHPMPDENGAAAAREALRMAKSLTEEDEAVFLVSGGGSALFESPLPGVTLRDIAEITDQLLRSGADITEINCVRKRLSAVKGGRFAEAIAPARVFSIILSDVLGDPLDMIASGPTVPDASTCAQALAIAEKYALRLSDGAKKALSIETPKSLENAEAVVTGSVTALCEAARRAAEGLGYPARVMDTALACEARDAGEMIALYADAPAPCALIWGGETVVHVRGTGRGGRNQELALAAAPGLRGHDNACVFAVGSDGTDGPTDAAGGIVMGDFCALAGEENVRAHLMNNDSYPLLKEHGALITLGPTGTNVNDLYVLLLAAKRADE